MEEQEIIPIKWGASKPGETQWTYGEHYRITVRTPIRHTVLAADPNTDAVTTSTSYLPLLDTTEVTIESVSTRRANLRDLIPFVVEALDRGHDFTVDHMEDGRSDPRGYTELSAPAFTYLLRSIYEIQKGHLD